MTCITCNGEVIDLQGENSWAKIHGWADMGWWYCPTCESDFTSNDIKIAELAHWKAVDEVFAGTESDDFDRLTGKLIDYSIRY